MTLVRQRSFDIRSCLSAVWALAPVVSPKRLHGKTGASAQTAKRQRLISAGIAARFRLLLITLFLTPTICADETTADFAKDVAPIFQQHCVRCHLPANKKGDVSLSTFKDLQSNDFVLAGDPDGSYLLELVAGVGGERPEMPKEGEPLSADEVGVIRRWIEQGAEWPPELVIREKPKADASWWSLQPLNAGDPRKHTKIDDFIRVKLAEQGLTLNPPADRRTLIRRATYDLIGLPPTPEEVESFVHDTSSRAYEQLIDRLLQSPHYGERWGRHWLDVVRFGESNGFERNVIINQLWPFRDYVIRSLNEDKPFDQFIREHLAGDVFGKDVPEKAVGSAFLVAGPYDDVGNQDAAQQAQIRANTLDEIIRATSEAFLGMTVGCARCHDHKFDPITQEDYYSMYATFAGVRHGQTTLATPEQRQERDESLAPLQARKSEIEATLASIDDAVLARANARIAEFEAEWLRPAINRMGTEEIIEPTETKFVRLVCEAADSNPRGKTFKLDEFEIWSAGDVPQNVALASSGAQATGKARVNEDFPGVYGPHLAIDGKTGERFISASNDITIELHQPTAVERFVFSSARDEANPQQGIFGGFPADYRIEVSTDGEHWVEVANGGDRKPANESHRNHRLLQAETTSAEQTEKRRLREALAKVGAKIASIPQLPAVWMGLRDAAGADGPFHVFLGGSPQKKGDLVVPTSLSVLEGVAPTYKLAENAHESTRRLELANWITRDNPLTARVLANRLWHYHFGTGIVDTPSDFGYMGGRPTHPRLLDFLALKLQQNGYRVKAMHRAIMLSDTYRQSSEYRQEAAKIDGDSRLLWRFPPRRLAAEEIRDTLLQVAGKLPRSDEPIGRGEDTSSQVTAGQLVPDGGPGFRLYRYMQDNVSTYTPLDQHGPETYRRAVYHQNVRAAVVDLMTEFDQPDCTFSASKRAETTTPLQALTMLNHSFTLDMATALAARLEREAGDVVEAQLSRAFQLCYSREPKAEEAAACGELIRQHGLAACCRVLLNTSELIYVP